MQDRKLGRGTTRAPVAQYYGHNEVRMRCYDGDTLSTAVCVTIEVNVCSGQTWINVPTLINDLAVLQASSQSLGHPATSAPSARSRDITTPTAPSHSC